MQLHDLFDVSLVAAADRPGLEIEQADGARQILTFGEINARANRVALALEQRGVAPGDRVAVHLANRLEFLDLFLACLRLRAVFVPINILYKQREIAHIVADAAPRLLIAVTADESLYPDGVRIVDVKALADEADGLSTLRSWERSDGDAPAMIIYTSGTTGRSKGAVLSHNNVLANTVNIVTTWQITAADRYLAVLPLFHVHGLANGVCGWLASGCTMRLIERFDRSRLVAMFETFRPTLFFGVPTIYVDLLAIEPDAAARIGRNTRLFVSGSAPLPPVVFEAFRDRFGHDILERYGMSETLMLISNPYVGERRVGTVGLPLPGVSIRIVNPDGSTVPTGSIGQVLVRGSNVFAGYWRQPEATASAFDDGWFRTGDLGERSADGYCTLRGRATDLIICNGFNIYPREIEDFLLECPGVREVAVAGSPDARRGQVPVAYVVADETFNEQVTSAMCRHSLAVFKVPRAFVRVAALPRNALGKVQKHLL